MNSLLCKLCERAEQELWDILKEEEWTKDCAEVAFYLTEMMKGVKKMEHLKLVQEAMERAEEEGESKEHMLGKEQDMSHYARRRKPMTMYDYDEGEGEGYPRKRDWRMPPMMYEMGHDEKYWEKKYKELWEEKEKEKKEEAMKRMPPPPPGTNK